MRLQLFTGKGGVGKTTLAAATAIRMASAGRKVLVVSTDPAHSLADVLDVTLGAEPAEVAANGLFAAQIDARRLVDREWARLRQHLGTIMAGAGIDEVVAEELTVLPGVEELLALSEVAELAGSGLWEAVVVDCAPTAETLRLLALPEAVAGMVERLFPAHRRLVRGVLAGLAGARSATDRWDAAADALSRLVERAEALRAVLADGRTTSVRLVLTAERVVVAETRRTFTALALLGIRVDGLVVNRLVPEPPVSGTGPAVRWLRARRAEQDAVLAELTELVEFAGRGGDGGRGRDGGGAGGGAGVPLHTVAHEADEPVGLAALARLGAELDDGEALFGEAPGAPGALLSVRRRSGTGRALDAEFELTVALPLAAGAAVDLTRIGDELAITVDGRRRLLALPSVLRRCVVTGAEQHAGGLRVLFQPDPDVWLR